MTVDPDPAVYTDDDWAWHDHAQCRTDPAVRDLAAALRLTVTELFYPGPGVLIPWEVRDCCARCPVRPDCLAWAIEHEHHGYWGGSSEKARRHDRRRLGIRASPAAVDTETWLTGLHVPWTYQPAVPLDQIDKAAGIANQARLQALDDDVVDRYADCMTRGDQFPPILLNRRNKKLVPIGGNHRLAAAHQTKQHTIAAYIVEAPAEMATRLMYEDNRRHGLPPSEDERLAQACHLVNTGYKPDDAAAVVGITRNKVERALGQAKADARAHQLRVPGWDKLPKTVRWRLGAIRSDPVFTQAALLLAAVVECQVTPIDQRTWQRRTADYNNLGFPVLWVWGMQNFANRNTRWNSDEFRVRSGTLNAHLESRNIIYVFDDAMRLLAVTLGDAQQRPGRYVNGDMWIDAYSPRTLRRWMSTAAGETPIRSESLGGLELVEFRTGNIADRAELTLRAARMSPPLSWDIAPPEPEEDADWAYQEEAA